MRKVSFGGRTGSECCLRFDRRSRPPRASEHSPSIPDCERIHMHSKLSLVGVLVGAIWSAPVLSHDIYSNLTDRNGKLCCNKHDCRPAHFKVSPAGVAMLVEGNWLRVPDDLVVHRTLIGDTGETRGGHWCGSTDWGGRDGAGHAPYPLRVTYCAIVPPSFAFVTLNDLPR
jgi:hypothetical protein